MVGDGFRVGNYLPGYGKTMEQGLTSPFIMLDYNAPWSISPQSDGHRPGVGFHPHRGFETVTIVYSGEVEHQDSAGGGGVIGADEVQWMTAGSGLMHNEFMTSEFSRRGGIQHAVQLWVNLPSAHKMTPPRYQALTRESIPEIDFAWWKVRVIAGQYDSVGWIAKTFSPVELYDIRFTTGGEWVSAFPPGYTTLLLVTEGSIMIWDREFTHGDMIHFSRTGEEVSFTGAPDTKVLLMAGEPLGEPIAHYGPFVMNTQREIEEAIADFNAGKFNLHD